MKARTVNILILLLLFSRVLGAQPHTSIEHIGRNHTKVFFSHFALRNHKNSDIGYEYSALPDAEVRNSEEEYFQTKRFAKSKSAFSTSAFRKLFLFETVSFSNTVFKDLFLRYAVLRV
jgi:hypothetical protein